MRKLVVFITLLLTACSLKEANLTSLSVVNVSADTVFQATKTASNQATKISLCVVGFLDDSTSIILRNPRQPERKFWITFPLPKGRIDSLRGNFDYYDSDVEILYQHKNTKRGNLKLLLRY
jgi:hypothetical protein